MKSMKKTGFPLATTIMTIWRLRIHTRHLSNPMILRMLPFRYNMMRLPSLLHALYTWLYATEERDPVCLPPSSIICFSKHV